MVILKKEKVYGWGRAASVESMVARPKTVEYLKTYLDECVRRQLSVTIRAGGNSYGDLITNRDGAILDITALNQIIDLDLEKGRIVVQAGVPLGRIIDTCLPHHWSLAVVPGSPFVTVGGAIGNNVHGKNAFSRGNFDCCVHSMRVMSSGGTIKNASREENPDLFNAVIGGLGMCGIIVEATLALERVKSPYLEVELVRFGDAEEMVDIFNSSEDEWDMLVAWMDGFDAKGRGVLERGRWTDAPAEANATVPTAMPDQGLSARFRRLIGVLCRPFMAGWEMRLINALFYRLKSGPLKTKILHFAQFNFIVTTKIPELPDLYPGGMIEVQLMLPAAGGGQSFEQVIGLCKAHKMESWWVGIKKHRADDFPLSFSGDGYSFSVNLPGRCTSAAAFPGFIDELVALITGLGGRAYLGKDLVLRPEHVSAMYPRIPEFLAARRDLDSATVFESDLARRLFSV